MIQYIQILRFAAAMWVALYHAQHWSFFPHLPACLRLVVSGGYAGVDIFFVISGVIMALSTADAPAGAKAGAQFVLTRFSRIYTGWWPALLMYFVVLGTLQQLPAHLDLTASALLYPSDFTRHISPVIWSLVYELYFYLIIGASLLVPARWRMKMLGAVALGLLALTVHFVTTNRFAPEMFVQATPLVWFYAAPLVLEFFAGYFLYRWLRRFPGQDWRVWLMATVALMAYAAYFGLHKTTYAPGLSGFYHWPERALYIGTASAALVGTALLAPAPHKRITLHLARLGDYSYAIYLLHPLVFTAMTGPLLWINSANRYRSVSLIAVMLVLLLVSALYYRWIEHPVYEFFRRKIRQWLSPRP